ncbi:MAG TPA: alkaline phosphatase family protein [Nitrososphaerales archaeon]|nr:alkaline phosphatase family protein [Nitrososphaerales archaeon]
MAESKNPQANFDLSGFVKPGYDGHSIANIPETVAQILGGNFTRPLKYDRINDFKDAKHVVLLLLDGLGSKLVESARKNYGVPSFERVSENSNQLDITSVFPSTTASAISSLHTGLTPQEHGVIGYTMYLRELGLIGQMLRFSPMLGGRSLFDIGLDRQKFLGGETIHERLGKEGMDSTVYVPRYIMDSGLSQLTYRGALVEPQNSAADMLVGLRKNLEKAKRKSFHFAYHPSPDTLLHAHGPYSEEYAVELESIFRIVESELFRKLDRSVAKDTVLIISGDHGGVHIERENVIDLFNHPKLLGMLKLPPTGDSRAAILHIKEGEEDGIRKYFDQYFENLFEIRTSKWLLDQGYFGLGRVKAETYDRIGDLVALPRSYNAMDNSIIDPNHGSIPGRHGGLSEEEMKVPCVITRIG